MAEAAQAYHHDTPTLKAFIRQHSITMSADRTDTNPNMAGDEGDAAASHWRCTLRCGRRQMTVYFSQGPAISGEPTIEDVLDCLALDASGADSFEDWCAEYGYDTDSRKAEHIYNTVRKQTEELASFLGPELYEALLTTERGL